MRGQAGGLLADFAVAHPGYACHSRRYVPSAAFYQSTGGLGLMGMQRVRSSIIAGFCRTSTGPDGTRRSISSANWLWRARQALSCADGCAEPRRMALIASSKTALNPGGMAAVSWS